MNATALKRFRVNGRNTPPSDSSAPARPTVPPTTRHGFTGHVAGTIRCSCSTCWSSIRQGSGMHLRFVCAARECVAMKRTTFPPVCLSHGTSWSCLTDQSQQRERQLRTAPATHRLLVRLAERLRSITSASKRGIERHDQSSHKPDLARGGASGGGASCAEMPLRTEGVASFAEVSCATRSNFDSSATKPGSW